MKYIMIYVLLCCNFLLFSIEQSQNLNVNGIATNPNEAFFELVKLKQYRDFLVNDKHPYLKKFDLDTKMHEIEVFEDSYEIANIPFGGYLSSVTLAIEEFKLFDLLKQSSLKKRKNNPQLHSNNGFEPIYGEVVLLIQKLSIFTRYRIIMLLHTKKQTEALQLLSNFADAELLTMPSSRTIKFINFLLTQDKYHLNDNDKAKLRFIKKQLKNKIFQIQSKNY